jgi:acyl carrier protein
MSATTTNTEVRQVVTEALVSFGADADQITADATFAALDVDSLDLAEMAQIIDDKFGVELNGNDVKGIETIDDLVALVVSRS